jgi:hypothetical protein
MQLRPIYQDLFSLCASHIKFCPPLSGSDGNIIEFQARSSYRTRVENIQYTARLRRAFVSKPEQCAEKAFLVACRRQGRAVVVQVSTNTGSTL